MTPRPAGGVVNSPGVTAEALLGIRDIGGYSGTISVSPDGRWVAYQTQRANIVSNSYDIDWYLLRTTGNHVAQRFDTGGEVILNSSGLGRVNGSRADIEAKWSPDSTTVAYLKRQDGQTQIWIKSLSAAATQLTSSDGDVEEFDWTRDGHNIVFRTSAPRFKASQVDEAEARSGYLFDNRFFADYARKPLPSDCSDVLFMNYPRDEERCAGRRRIVVIASGEEQPISDEASREPSGSASPIRPESLHGRSISSLVASSDGRRFAWLENEDPKTFAGFMPPRRVFLSTPEARCSADACVGLQMEGLWWSNGDKELIIQKREGVKFSRSAFYAWNPHTNVIRNILVTEDKIYACGRSAQELICLHEGWTSPRKIVSLDWVDGTIRTLFEPNKGFGRGISHTIEKLELDDGFGNDVVAHVVYPLNYQQGIRYPAVVVQYRSRGFLRGGVGDEYPIQLFAANGFVVISFDRPDDYDVDSRIADVVEREKIAWKDFYDKRSALNAIGTILDGLDRRGVIDASRVGLTGLSDGAETLQYALIHFKRFAAAAVSGTYWSPSVYFLAPAPWRKVIEGQFGEPYENLDRWRGISLSLNAKAIDTPLLIQVSDQELMATLEDYSALAAVGKPVEMFVFPDGYHIKWIPSQKLAVSRRTLQWMKFWLRDEEDNEPVDPKQYYRWRRLKEAVPALAN